MNYKFRNPLILILVFALSPLIIISFQNCAPAMFKGFKRDEVSPNSSDYSEGGGSGGAATTFRLLEQSIQTGFNQPATWLASFDGARNGHVLSFSSGQIQNESHLPNVGSVKILNAHSWQLQFEPNFGFRGEILFWLFAHQNGQQVSQSQIAVTVGSAINILKPALAIRASGCIMCHAEVHSNIVTDFGFGNDFYFGQNVHASFAWNDGSPYGDHDAFLNYGNGHQGVGAWARLKFFSGLNSNHTAKIIVPRAAIPNGPRSATGKSSLKGYLQHRLIASEYLATRSAQVEEKSNVYIGAPTSQRLQQVFLWGASDEVRGFKFFPHNHNSWSLSGLNIGNNLPVQRLFSNDSALVCEGDLLIKGSLYLNRVRIRTRTGCRLYVTEDVLISGPIEYLTDVGADYSLRNLQITSSRAIIMGLGNLWRNGQHCEQDQSDSGYWGYYKNRLNWTAGMTASQRQQFEENIADSAKYRLRYFWGIPNFFLRQASNPSQLSEAIYSSLRIRVPNLLDAACEPEQRNVRFERILLNAPLIHSRYAGGIRGSVIAEFALMPLGLSQNQSRFRFEFDPVFSRVDILPMLKDQDFLKVQ